MKLSRARVGRTLRWAALDFMGVQDPRDARGRRHDHHGLLSLMVVALGAASKSLRDVENFSEELPARTRRLMGLQKGVSDTALYEWLARQAPAGLATVLLRQVKQALLKKQLRNDLFGCGVVTVDGKHVWEGPQKVHRLSQRCEHEEGTTWRARAQRVCLTSSSARPCVYQRYIPGKTNEMGACPDVFAWLLQHFERSFEVVTHDAGACSRENAQLVHEAQKAYVFSVKENQPSVLRAALTRLGSRDVADDQSRSGEARSDDRARGFLVTREIFRSKVEAQDPEVELPGAKELWRVRQTKVRRNDAGKELERLVSDRYFVTNRVFGAERALKLVRLHWGIENGSNWAMDVVMGEDDGSPCLVGHGLETVSWLRLLALNLLAMLRGHLPEAHGEQTSFSDAARALRLALSSLPSLSPEFLATLG